MVDANKKFQGGRRYYHRPAMGAEDSGENPRWPEHQEKLRREKQSRLLRRFGMGLFLIGVVAGTFYLLSL